MEHSSEELLGALYQQYLSETVQLKEQIANLKLTIQKLEDQLAEAGSEEAGDATQE